MEKRGLDRLASISRRVEGAAMGPHHASNPYIEFSVPTFQVNSSPLAAEDGANPDSSRPLTEEPRAFLVSPSGNFFCPMDEEIRPEADSQEQQEEDEVNLEETVGQGIHIISALEKITMQADVLARTVNWKKKQAKRVDADEDILATYHDSFLYGKLPITTRVRTRLRTGWFSFSLRMLEFIAAAISAVYYIASTYAGGDGTVSEQLFLGFINVFFVFDYILKFYSAPVRLAYVLSTGGITDFLTSLPCIFFFIGESFEGAFFRILLFVRLFRPLSSLKTYGLIKSSIVQEIITLIVYLLSIISVATGLLQWVERISLSEEDLAERGCPPNGCINFYDSFYWVIVTISTVGYGDFTPDTTWGRLVIILLIFTTLVIVPVQINEIVEVASRSPYGGMFLSHRTSARYIILCGRVSYSSMMEFLYTFFHPVHSEDLKAYPLRVVVLAPFKPSFEMKSLISLYNGLVEFIEGSPINWKDLDRVTAKRAAAIFILGEAHPADPDAEDSAQFVQALSVNRYCGPSVRVIVEVADPSSEHNAIWDDTGNSIETVCPQNIRFKLLACSVFIKGVTTFVVNLFRSGLYIARPKKDHFMSEYHKGNLQEVYPVLLPRIFRGLLFEEVVEFVYLQFGVVLFGLDLEVPIHSLKEHARRDVVLYPKRHVIGPSDVGLVIAQSLITAEKISRFGEKERHHCVCIQGWRCSCIFPNLQEVSEVTGIQGSRKSGWQERAEAMALFQEVRERWARVSHPLTGHVPLPHPDSSKELSCSQDESGRKFAVRQVDKALWHATGGAMAMEAAKERGSGDGEGNLGKSLGSDNPLTDEKGSESESTQGPSSDGIEKLRDLEEVVEKLLSWPPLTLKEKPHSAILYRREAQILEHLANRTLSVVSFRVAHVLVCMGASWSHNLYAFVAHLRKEIFSQLPIVFLSPIEPDARQWGCLGIFEEVYFLKGSPMYELDLVRAGVVQAAKVLVLTTDGQCSDNEHIEQRILATKLATENYLGDVTNLVVAANVERLLGSGDRLLVELQHELTFQYMQPKWLMQGHWLSHPTYRRNRDAAFQLCPPFQCGKAFSPYSLSFLTHSNFYNRNTCKIVERLLCGTPGSDDVGTETRRLWQVPVPDECDGKTFAELLVHLLHTKEMLALGLFRAKGTKGSLAPFVHTNPAADVIVQSKDLVYVIL